MDKQKITIMGKTIDYSNFSDEQLLSLYTELKKREAILYKRIMKYNEEYNFLPEINLN